MFIFVPNYWLFLHFAYAMNVSHISLKFGALTKKLFFGLLFAKWTITEMKAKELLKKKIFTRYFQKRFFIQMSLKFMFELVKTLAKYWKKKWWEKKKNSCNFKIAPFQKENFMSYLWGEICITNRICKYFSNDHLWSSKFSHLYFLLQMLKILWKFYFY